MKTMTSIIKEDGSPVQVTIQEGNNRKNYQVCYASRRLTIIHIKNIDKQVTIGGDRYNYATEYYSGKKIMFTGDFTKMLNGDSAIMFGIYKGTDINDIPGFDAYFLEFHNGDF